MIEHVLNKRILLIIFLLIFNCFSFEYSILIYDSTSCLKSNLIGIWYSSSEEIDCSHIEKNGECLLYYPKSVTYLCGENELFDDFFINKNYVEASNGEGSNYIITRVLVGECSIASSIGNSIIYTVEGDKITQTYYNDDSCTNKTGSTTGISGDEFFEGTRIKYVLNENNSSMIIPSYFTLVILMLTTLF